MALRFRRSVKIAPGMRLNVGKKSASVRIGGRGFGVTTGTAGSRVSAGIPGSGLYTTKKIGGGTSKGRQAARRPRHNQDLRQLSLPDILRSVGPTERAVRFPAWWITGLIMFVAMAPSSGGGTLLFAAPCGYVTWRRLRSPAYRALKTIKAARRSPSERSDTNVHEAAKASSRSWTVQREAGMYFVERKLPHEALFYLGQALNLFPGDKRPYLAMTASAAIDAKQFTHTIVLLEPQLPTCDPDHNEVDVIIINMLAWGLHQSGDPGRALEVVNRLPLRRKKLSQPLLFGLCVRAMAKHALGKKADAKRDLDRVYAIDPVFPMLAKVEAATSLTSS